MVYSNLVKSVLAVIDDPILEGEIEERFKPFYTNDDLVDSINHASVSSPVFREAVLDLEAAVERTASWDFVREYERFHNTVMILSDQVALTIKKEADLIENIDIPVSSEEGSHFISSRLFIGNSMLLMFTSNTDLLHKTLENFKKPVLKSKIVSEMPSA